MAIFGILLPRPLLLGAEHRGALGEPLLATIENEVTHQDDASSDGLSEHDASSSK